MRLFQKEEINKKRNDQNRDLLLKNEKITSSLKKILKLQNSIDFDAEKAQKVKNYKIWCEELQNKMSTELGNLKNYQKMAEEKKEEYYYWIAKVDALKDDILNLKEEISRLSLQVKWQKEILNKQNA